MNKVGYWLMPSFPRQRYVVVVIIGTMTPSDSLSSIHHFVCTYRFLLYFRKKVTRRVSPVPLTTLLTCRSPYPERFFGAVFPSSPHLPWSSPIFTSLDFSLSLFKGLFLRGGRIHFMLQPVSLLALSTRVTLSQGFNLRISPPVACQLLSVLALTQVGLPPTSN